MGAQGSLLLSPPKQDGQFYDLKISGTGMQVISYYVTKSNTHIQHLNSNR
jgi:hypothetical protein